MWHGNNVISGFRNNRGQNSAHLFGDFWEPRNTSSSSSPSSLSELRLFDFGILPRTKYLMPPLPTLHLWYDACLLYASPITHSKEWQTHLRQTAYRACLLCARQSFVLTHTRQQQQQQQHQNHHTSTTPAPHQHHTSTTPAPHQQRQHQRRWWPNVAGDSVRARLSKKNTGKRENNTYATKSQIKIKTTFQESGAIMDAPPLFLMQLFQMPQNYDKSYRQE